MLVCWVLSLCWMACTEANGLGSGQLYRTGETGFVILLEVVPRSTICNNISFHCGIRARYLGEVVGVLLPPTVISAVEDIAAWRPFQKAVIGRECGDADIQNAFVILRCRCSYV